MWVWSLIEDLNMSRLTIDLTDEQHKQLKAFAALEGKTIRQFATERLFPAKDELDEDWERFKEFIGKRVDDALASEPSKRTIMDIADDGMRRFKAA
jgi:Antitoxin ParD